MRRDAGFKKNEKLREVAVIWHSSYTLIALKFVDCWSNNYFPWRFRGKKLFFIHWLRYSTRSQWSSSLRMSRMNPRWFFTSFAKKENSRIRNIYFGRVWQDIRHSWPKKSSFFASISDEIGRMLRRVSYMSAADRLFQSSQPYKTEGRTTNLYNFVKVNGLR